MAHYSGVDLSNLLSNAQPFFSDTPPPGAALQATQAALPAPTIELESRQPAARFDMGGMSL